MKHKPLLDGKPYRVVGVRNFHQNAADLDEARKIRDKFIADWAYVGFPNMQCKIYYRDGQEVA